ncbi:MAG: autotransporter-associated beta strand repeat-containing protein [Verrucomicrobia bacterium]|nr:autotransporter-associated beta strand repeat-containing protein [Verrucomicrobiota bacterium]
MNTRSTSGRRFIPLHLGCAALAWLTLTTAVEAAAFIRANNATALNTAGAWTNAGVPAINDIVVWDGTVTTPAFCTNAPTAAVTWGGIRVSNAPATVSITNQTITLNTNASGTLLAGIEVAGANLSIGSGSIVNVNVPQTWTVASGRTLSLETGNLLTIRRDLTMTGLIQHGRGIDIVSNATLNIGPGTMLVATNGTGSLFRIAQGSGLSGTVNQTGGTNIIERAGTAQVMALGNAQNATGTYNLSGGLLELARSNNSTLNMANNNNAGCVGVLNISGTGRLNAAIINAGASTDPGAVARITVNGTGQLSAITVITDQTVFTTTPTVTNTFAVSEFAAVTVGSLTVGSRGPCTFTITNTATVVITNTFQLAGASGTNEGSGTLNLDGGTLTIPAITRGGGSNNASVVNFNGGQMVVATNSLTFAATNTGANNGGITLRVQAGGARIDTAGYGITNVQPLLHATGVNPDGGLLKTGLGTLATFGTNTYSGPTVVSAGALFLSTVHSGGGSISNADGTSLGVVVTKQGSSALASSLALGSNTGAALFIDVGTNGNSTAPVIVATNLTVNGIVDVTITAAGAGLSVGTFTLIDYTGTINGSGSFNLASVPPGVVATIETNTGNTSIDLNVASIPVNLTWNGNVNADWVGPLNWRDPALAPTAFSAGSIVTFDDTATGTTAINLASPVTVGGLFMTFANVASNYAITGAGAIGGTAGLLKTGAGSLTMGVSNNYPGDTILSAGKFTLAANDVIPDGLGRGNLLLEGTLDLNGFSDSVNGFTGTNGTGLVTNTGGSPATFTIGSNGVAGSFNGTIAGAGLTLQKVGGQTNKLLGTNTHTGGNIFRGGTVEITNGIALGASTAPLTIGGSTLRTFDNVTNTAPVFTLMGNATFAITNNSTVFITGNIFTTNTADIITVNGAGTLRLSGSGEFGNLRPDNATVILAGGSITNNASVGIGRGTLGVGTLVLDGATLHAKAAVNVAEATGTTGTLHITNGARLEFIDFYVGKVGSTTGAVFQSGGVATNTAVGADAFGIAGNNANAGTNSTGSYFLSGGRLDVIHNWNIGSDGTGLFNLTGGEANSWLSNVSVGHFAPAARGTLRVAGGTFNQRDSNGTFIIGQAAAGTLEVTNTGLVTAASTLQLGSANTGAGTVYLGTGGRLQAPGVIGGAGKSLFYFRGGTLEATANSTSFIALGTNPVAQAYVGSAGANLDTGTNSITIAQRLLNDTNTPDAGGGVTKLGTGNLTLAATNTYTNTTLVSAGKLFVAATYAGTSPVAVADGAGMGAVRDASGATPTVNALTLGSAGATTFDFDLGIFGNPATPVLNVGNLTNNGTTTTVNFSGGNFTNGTFTLIAYGAPLPNAFDFVLGGVPRGVAAALVDNSASNKVDLTITAVTALTWRGTNGNTWDISTTTNWLLAGADASYLEADNVLFDDTGAATPTVNLVTNVSPSLVTVSNTIAYTITGTNRITGPGGLIKLGSGPLILATSNDYTGPTLISAGTLRLGTNEVIPNGTGKANLTVNGTFDLNGFNETVMGLDGSGVIDNTGASNVLFIIGANASSGSFAGAIQDTGGDLLLQKNGAGTNTLSGVSTWNGGTFINAGRLQVAGDTALGLGQIGIGAGTLASAGGDRILSNAVVVNFTANGNSTIIDTSGGNLTLAGPVTWNGPEFTKNGANALIIGPTSVATLDTTAGLDLNAGSLVINGGTWTQASDGFRVQSTSNAPLLTVTVQSNGVLNLQAGASLQLGRTDDTNAVTRTTNLMNLDSGGLVKLDTGDVNLGYGIGTAGIINQSGGTLAITNPAQTNGLTFNRSTNTLAVYNLNGGTLITPRLRRGQTTNTTGQFVFGGGTLQASGSRTNFLEGLSGVLVRAAGARIDSDVFNITINQPLILDVTSLGGGLVKLGAGTLFLNGVNTYTGATIVSNGTLAGSGFIAGSVSVAAGGLISAGNSIGTLTINTALTIAGGAFMEINRTNAQTADLLAAGGAITYGGTLTVTNIGDALQSGDTFNLFDAASFTGAFTTFNLPALTNGMQWDTSQLVTNGTLTVITPVVPPATPAVIYNVIYGGTNVQLIGGGGVANAVYRVLSETNMTTPYTNWVPVTTNNFDPGGNFDLTFPVTPEDLRRFYLIIFP